MSKTAPLTLSKLLGNFFALFVLFVISFIYYNVVHTFHDRYREPKIFLFLFIFHYLLFMLLWCFFRAMLTDPGVVPPLWGFYMGDSEQKRRRYCLMCHVFKPERSHHCSACNRCVLNMDHHCPWINNCVGFYNRKFFILLLVYVLISTTLITITLFPTVYASVKQIIEKRDIYAYKEAALFSAYLLNCLLNGVMFMFLKFHIKLIFTNITTIENMDKQNLPNLIVYNKGYKRNWIQVFGRNPWLWPFPMTGRSGKPVGDGVIWNDEVVQNFDEEIPANENEARRSSRLTGSGVAASRERLASPVRQGSSLEGTRKEFESTLDSSSRVKADSHHVGLLVSP